MTVLGLTTPTFTVLGLAVSGLAVSELTMPGLTMPEGAVPEGAVLVRTSPGRAWPDVTGCARCR